jgi:hypothetical protein
MSQNSSNQLFFLADEKWMENCYWCFKTANRDFDDRVMMVNVRFKGVLIDLCTSTHMSSPLTYVAGRFEVSYESW